MTTLLERLLSVSQFEIIVINNKVPQAFRILAEDSSVEQLIAVKQTLESLPEDIFSRYVLKPNIVRFLDAMIRILEEDEETIAELQSENRRLERKNAKLRRAIEQKPKTTTSRLVLDGGSSERLRKAMTIQATFR
jgi:hypothetical protein